jgi:hypothetical protein
MKTHPMAIMLIKKIAAELGHGPKVLPEDHPLVQEVSHELWNERGRGRVEAMQPDRIKLVAAALSGLCARPGEFKAWDQAVYIADETLKDLEGRS